LLLEYGGYSQAQEFKLRKGKTHTRTKIYTCSERKYSHCGHDIENVTLLQKIFTDVRNFTVRDLKIRPFVFKQ